MLKLSVALPVEVVRVCRRLGDGNLSAGIRILYARYYQNAGRSTPGVAATGSWDDAEEHHPAPSADDDW